MIQGSSTAHLPPFLNFWHLLYTIYISLMSHTLDCYFVHLFSFQTRCKVSEGRNHVFSCGVKESVSDLGSDALGSMNH